MQISQLAAHNNDFYHYLAHAEKCTLVVSDGTFSEYTFSELKYKTYLYGGRRQMKHRQLYQRSPEGASDGDRRCSTVVVVVVVVTHQLTHQVQSHLDPDNPAPVDDLEGYQTLVHKEPHPCAVNLL